MGLLKFFIVVLLPILLEYGVQGVSFDYADPNDFKNRLSVGGHLKKLSENVTGNDVAELCAHGTKYKIDCNSCACDERTGVTRCTRKKCREGTFSNCIHGTHFMEDCNRCRCSVETGITTCTLKKCRNNKNKLAGVCPHGEYYSPDGCNRCHCNLSSGATRCTLVNCYIIEDDEWEARPTRKCPYGIRFSNTKDLDWCKNCHCDPKTGETRCTKVGCFTVDEGIKTVRLSAQLVKNKNLKLTIKEAVTGCTPPEVILIGSCRCDCRLPSVAVCKESCFLDPVG